MLLVGLGSLMLMALEFIAVKTDSALRIMVILRTLLRTLDRQAQSIMPSLFDKRHNKYHYGETSAS
jgi:hypothetical protein